MRLIDVDALAKEIAGRIEESEENMEFGQVEGLEGAWCCVDNAPTIDAVEVVRCKDCKWYGTYQLTKYGEYDRRYKPTVCINGEYSIMRNEDWYCADGERKADNETIL